MLTKHEHKISLDRMKKKTTYILAHYQSASLLFPFTNYMLTKYAATMPEPPSKFLQQLHLSHWISPQSILVKLSTRKNKHKLVKPITHKN